MRLFVLIAALIVVVTLSCGHHEIQVNKNEDSVHNADSLAALDTNAVEGSYDRLTARLPSIDVPSFVHIDSIGKYPMYLVSIEQCRGALFPEDFEIPYQTSIRAFAQMKIDDACTGIWYFIKTDPPLEEEWPDGEDVLLVLYAKDHRATAGHYFATRGYMSGHSRICAPDSIREVNMEQMEEVKVTTRTVRIKDGDFVIKNETETNFGIGDTAYPASQVLIKSYLSE